MLDKFSEMTSRTNPVRARQLQQYSGLGAVILALAGLALVLIAPIIPVCSTAVGATCVGGGTRHVGLLGAQADAGAWIVIVLPCVVACAAGVAAFVDARQITRRAMVPLGIGVALGLLVCTVAATGTLAVYIPAELAVTLAGYAAIVRRWQRNAAAR